MSKIDSIIYNLTQQIECEICKELFKFTTLCNGPYIEKFRLVKLCSKCIKEHYHIVSDDIYEFDLNDTNKWKKLLILKRG